jgi:hypothetical protein
MWLTSGKTYSDLVSNANSFVTVSDTGNPSYSGTVGVLGNVNYTYQISKYEITNSEYVLFLNSVDPFGIDPNDIYDPLIGGGISMDNTRVAGYRYYVSNEVFNNKPLAYINFSRATRFCNWLHNGAKKYRTSDANSTAPQNNGAYNIGISTTLYIASTSYSKFRLPTYSEWFKSAYYNGSGSYYLYATQSNNLPISVFAKSNGDGDYKILNLLSNLEFDILRNNNSNFNKTNTNITNLEIDTLRNNTRFDDRVSNLELDVLRNNNSKFNITNSIISNLEFDILSNKPGRINTISASYNDIFSSTTNSIHLQDIITYYNCDVLTSFASSYSNLSNFQIDILSSNKIINTQISMLNIDYLCSEKKKYLINNIFACDVLCNKKS